MEDDEKIYLHYGDKPKNILRQYLAATSIALGQFSSGAILTQSTLMAHQLQLGKLYTDHQIYSAVSIMAVGMMVGAVLSSLPLTYWGPRSLTMFLCMPTVVAAVMTSYGGSLTTLLLGRLTLGVVHGLCASCITAFIGDISSAHRRGLLSTIPDLMSPIGALVTIALGWVMSWKSESVLLITACQAIKFFGLLMVRESPRWLRAFGNDQASRSSWRFYHTIDEDPKMTPDREMNLHVDSSANDNLTYSQMFCQLKAKHVRIPVAISCSMYALKNLSGMYFIASYSVQLMDEASGEGTTTGYPGSSALLAAAVVGSALACRLCDRVGRRPLLLTTSAVNTVLFLLLAAVYEVDAHVGFMKNSFWRWLPVTKVVVFFFVISLGVSPLADVLNSDLVPSALAPLANGIIFLVRGLVIFTSLQLLPYMLGWLGRTTLFVCFAVSNFAVIPITYFLLPETKNIELEQVQEIFRARYGRSHETSTNNSADKRDKECHCDVTKETTKSHQEEDSTHIV